MAERDAMEALEAADQRRKLTDPEHVERIRKYVEWPHTTRDIIVLDSDLVRITAGDLADLLAERDALSAKLQGLSKASRELSAQAHHVALGAHTPCDITEAAKNLLPLVAAVDKARAMLIDRGE